MVEQGRVVLLFDGFDELALKVAYDRVLEHFSTILNVAAGQARLVVTSRTSHFLNDDDVKTQLLERAESAPTFRLCRLQPFERSQIASFLHNFLRDAVAARARLKLIEEVEDLMGLSATPRMLSFIANLDEDKLREAKRRHGKITSAHLYQALVESWLKAEVEKQQPDKATPKIDVPELLMAITDLALLLWTKQDRCLPLKELTNAAGSIIAKLEVRATSLGRSSGGERWRNDEWAHTFGTRTLLIRNERGDFSFVHQSVMEWLVAKAAAEGLSGEPFDADSEPGRARTQRAIDPVARDRALQILSQAEMSKLMADFFCAMAGRDVAGTWAREIIAPSMTARAGKFFVRLIGNADAIQTQADAIAQTNATLVLDRLGEGTVAPAKLAGRDLRRVSLTRLELRGTDLRGCNLSGVNLAGRDLSRANLTEADLTSANLSRANLVGTDLSDANLTRANLLGADLSDVAGSAPRSMWRMKSVEHVSNVFELVGIGHDGYLPHELTSRLPQPAWLLPASPVCRVKVFRSTMY